MNRTIYLAGAISCYFNTDQDNDSEQWREDTKKYVKKLYEDITLISPTDLYKIGKSYHKSESMRFNLRMVREADIILVNLRDLHTSLGSSDEIFYAFISGKPIIGFLEDESDTKNVHPWKAEQIDRIETGKDAMKRAIDYIYGYYVDIDS
mgnify:CR=1 FL=1